MVKYPIAIVYDEESQSFVGMVPDLEGISVTGKTYEEAFERTMHAISEWLVVAEMEGLEHPLPRTFPGSDFGFLCDE